MAESIIAPPFEAQTPPAEAQLGYSSMVVGGGALTGLSYMQWSRRTGIVWNEVETTIGSGVYDWDVTDEEVTRAVANNYNMIFVVKVGHPEGHVDADCFQAVEDTNLGYPFDRLYSCPIKTTSQVHFKNFIRAFIRRYGFGTASGMSGVSAGFQMMLQIENEASSKKFWNRDITADGALAAQNYVNTVLRPAYEAKQAESWTGKIILQGLAVPENAATCYYNPDAGGYDCHTPANIRQRTFIEEVLKYPEYFDAVDLHLFSYQYFLPRSIDTAVDWVKMLCSRSGYTLGVDKELYCLEWTPAFIKHAGARTGGPGAMVSIYPYASDFAPVGYLDEAKLYDGEGNLIEDETPPCYFSGDYTGASTNTFAIIMSVVNSQQTPQQFQWTANYVGVVDTVWTGPVNCSTSPTSLTQGVSVTWETTTGYVAPFAVAAVAHPDTAPVDNDTLAYYYENLDFLETDTSLPAALQDSKHRKWFELEEAADFMKALCPMLARGITIFNMVKWVNYYPGFSWDERYWKFHGLIRVTGGTVGSPTIVKKPSWYNHLMFETYLHGYDGVNPYNIGAGVTCYQFNFTGSDPKYVMWATPTNTLDDPAYDGGDVVLATVDLALANLLGWTTAIAREVVTALDGSNNPVYTTNTVSGASTVTIGNIPKIVIKVA